MASPLSVALLLTLLMPAAHPGKQDLYKWRFLQKHKQVTHQYPTTYQVGGVYCLKQDVVVQRGGNIDSHVSEYRVVIYGIEGVKERLRDPQAARASCERFKRWLRSTRASRPEWT